MSAVELREAITEPRKRVIVALDGMGWEQAGDVLDEVSPHVGLAKANAIAQRKGWDHAIQQIGELGLLTMADPKYKDVPSTMRNHLSEIAQSAPALITIHADNTPAALEAAVQGRDESMAEFTQRHIPPRKREALNGLFGAILGVTVLTSYNEEDCVSIYGDKPEAKVLQFAHTAAEAGLDGIVCSGEELDAIRSDNSLDHLLTVVPGITPPWAKKAGDQQRIVTPSEAVQRGADFVVVGRAITKPPEGMNRTEAAQRIEQELAEAA